MLKRNVRMIIAIEFEWRMAGAGIFGIIICKPSHCLQPGPIVLLEVDKRLEIGLHFAVLLLYLAVSLRVKRGG